MKITQTLVITNPDDFLRGDYGYAFSLYNESNLEYIRSPHVVVGEIELDVNVSIEDTTITVIDAIDSQIKEAQADFNKKVAALQARKQELLSLTYEPEDFDEESQDEINAHEGAAFDRQRM